MLRRFDAGSVRGVGDVQDDADVGHQAVGGHLGAMPADLFLHGVDGVNRGVKLPAFPAEVGEHLGEMKPPMRLSKARPTR